MNSVRRLFGFQCAISTLLAVFFGLTFGEREAISSLVGSMVALLPSLIFAKKLFQYQGARSARQIMKSVYLGECLKIICAAALFTIVFAFCKVAPLAFFLTYIVVVLSHWCAPLLITNQHNRLEK